MGICIFNAAICHNQVRGCLFADSRYTRNIICGIAHQRLYINKLQWCNLIFFQYLFGIIIFDFRSGPPGLWNPDLNMVTGKLQ